MQAWLKADLWEKEVGHLADCSSRCLSQGLLADVMYVVVFQPNNRQHAMWPACINAQQSKSVSDHSNTSNEYISARLKPVGQCPRAKHNGCHEVLHQCWLSMNDSFQITASSSTIALSCIIVSNDHATLGIATVFSQMKAKQCTGMMICNFLRQSVCEQVGQMPATSPDKQ